MAKAYVYVRMSSAAQRDGDSYRRQLEMSAAYAQRNAIEIVDSSDIYDLGVSAFKSLNATQGGLGRFVQKVRSGDIPAGTYLLIESFDRLSRDKVPKAFQSFLELINRGIVIVTLVDEAVYGAESLQTSMLLLSLLKMEAANDESERKSQRVSAAWEAKRQTASEKLTAKCPAWLELLPNRREFKVHNDRKAIIRTIFQMAVDGCGDYTIMRMLNERGIKPFGRGTRWAKSSITKLLNNRALLGEHQHHQGRGRARKQVGRIIKDYYPAVIEESLFAEASSARKARTIRGSGRRGATQSNLFTHVAKCGYCGSSMRYIDKGSANKGGRYLVCASRLSRDGCDAMHWGYEDFERGFLWMTKESVVRPLLSSAAEAHRGAQDNLEFQRLASRLSALKRRLALAYEDTLNFDHGTPLRDQALAAASRIAEQVRELEEDLQHRTLYPKVGIVADDDFHAALKQLRGAAAFEVRSRAMARVKDLVCSIAVYPGTPQRRERKFRVNLADGTSRVCVSATAPFSYSIAVTDDAS